MEIRKEQQPHSTSEVSDEDQEQQNLPKGIIPLDRYVKDFHDFLYICGSEISKSFYSSIPQKKFKLTCVVKAKQHLLSFPIYECFLKFDGRFIMAAQKGLLGKLIISSDPKPEEDENMLTKLSSSLKKENYKLYEKVQGITQGKDRRTELAIIRYSKNADVIVIPKVDINTQIRKKISHRKEEHLEKQYIETKTKVTSLKLHRNVFRCEWLTRQYFMLRDMLSCLKSDKLVLRKIARDHWEYTFCYPLAPIQAFGFVLSLIDREVV